MGWKTIPRRRSVLSGMTCVACAFLAGCGSLPEGQGWGDNATFLPNAASLWEGAQDAFFDPWTWTPLILAGVLTVDDWEEEIADWAIEETPVFGSQDNATNWSNHLRDSLQILAVGSTLATDSGDDTGRWIGSKAKGLVLGLLTLHAAESVTSSVKGVTQRVRPDGSNDSSMPSRHTATASTYARWSYENVGYIHMPDNLRTPSRVGLMSMAALTGWARIEGAHHYPTDVLVGFALGNFFSRFTQTAFQILPDEVELHLSWDPFSETVAVGVTWSF